MNKRTLRPAIAMIELIFAIVIMGIVLMSTPMLISTAAKSSFVTIQQEAINEAASQLNMIMGYHWDESDTNEDYIPPILKVSGDTELNEVNISAEPTGRRFGTPDESYRAFVRADGNRSSASSTLGPDDTTIETGDDTYDDMDDFNGSTVHLKLIETSSADNVEKATDINISRTIAYSDDNASYDSSSITYNYNPSSSPGGSTNIKSITVILISNSGVEELDKEIILRAFSCNIGGYKLEEKDF